MTDDQLEKLALNAALILLIGVKVEKLTSGDVILLITEAFKKGYRFSGPMRVR